MDWEHSEGAFMTAWVPRTIQLENRGKGEHTSLRKGLKGHRTVWVLFSTQGQDTEGCHSNRTLEGDGVVGGRQSPVIGKLYNHPI